jgi:hypothetical protein
MNDGEGNAQRRERKKNLRFLQCFFTMKKEIAQAIWRSPSSLAIHSARPPCSYNYPINHHSMLAPSKKKIEEERKREHTFVMTAIEAKEFPKFIPMMVCKDGISMGSCALPFGTCPVH